MKYNISCPSTGPGLSNQRYTYILDDLTDMDALWGGLRENIRRECRKAEKDSRLLLRMI